MIHLLNLKDTRIQTIFYSAIFFVVCVFSILSNLALGEESFTQNFQFKSRNFKGNIQNISDDNYNTYCSFTSPLIIESSSTQTINGATLYFAETPQHFQVQAFYHNEWHIVGLKKVNAVQYIACNPQTTKLKLIPLNKNGGNFKLEEIKLFINAESDDFKPLWEEPKNIENLIIFNKVGDEILFSKQVSEIIEKGNTQVLLMNPVNLEREIQFIKNCWQLGIKYFPIVENFRDVKVSSSNTAYSKWGKANVVSAISSAIRETKPTNIYLLQEEHPNAYDDIILETVKDVFHKTNNPHFHTDTVIKFGLFQVSNVYLYKAYSRERIGENLEYVGNPSDEIQPIEAQIILTSKKVDNSSNTHTTQSPFQQLDSNTQALFKQTDFSVKEEYVYKNNDLGLWKYISPTLNISIERKEDKTIPLVWYVADIRSDVRQGEIFKTISSLNSKGQKEQILPNLNAQLNDVVFAINADYYSYRQGSSRTKGIDIRNKTELIYDDAYLEPTTRHPNLDILATYDDGNMEVYDGVNIKAQFFIDKGARDVFSFGPYLVKNGEINPKLYNVRMWDMPNPRIAIGMVEKGHYIVIIAEGRAKDSKGIDLDQLAKLMQEKGCQVAFNLDGGQTAVMLFMGEQINKIASYSGGRTTPRQTREVLGIGHSPKVEKYLVEKYYSKNKK